MCTCSGTIYETVPDENYVEQCYNLMLVKRVLPIRLLLKNISLVTPNWIYKMVHCCNKCFLIYNDLSLIKMNTHQNSN